MGDEQLAMEEAATKLITVVDNVSGNWDFTEMFFSDGATDATR